MSNIIPFAIGTFFILLGMGLVWRSRRRSTFRFDRKVPPKGPSKTVEVYKGEGVPYP